MSWLRFFIRTRGVSALSDPEVASALRLRDTQKLRLADVQRANAQSLRDVVRRWTGASGGIQRLLRGFQRDADVRLLGVLDPQQRDQFQQLRGN